MIFIHPTAIVDEPTTIGEGTRIWHFCHLTAGCVIGQNCTLGQGVYVGGAVVVGNGVKIQNNVSLFDGVQLHDNVFVGPSAVFTNVKNPRAHRNQRDRFRPTVVEEGATIGANATIVCGTTIGAYAFIGAGAVVTKHVPPHARMLGVPAVQRGWVCNCGESIIFETTCETCGFKL